MKKLIVILASLILLTPLGLIAEGSAWGEWSAQELIQIKGYVPEGIRSAKSFFTVIFPDYTIKLFSDSPAGNISGYITSAIAGVALIAVFFALFTLFLKKN